MTMMNSPSQKADQAKTLRALSEQLSDGAKGVIGAGSTARVFSVTSGKGGVGKTAVTTNVAVTLASQGKRVLIVDADLGLANVDVMLGLAPEYNLNHFFTGERSLEEVMVDGPAGIKVLPAGSGTQNLTRLDSTQKRLFLDAMDAMHDRFDVVIIDTEAGISENVTYFNAAAQDIIVVTAPEPTAITDAYALMKLLSTRYDEKQFKLVVNSVRDDNEGLEVYRKLTMVSSRYLDISLDYLGSIPYDKKMHEAISRQKVIVDLYPNSRSSLAFKKLTQNLLDMFNSVQPKGTAQFFWSRLLSLGQGGSA